MGYLCDEHGRPALICAEARAYNNDNYDMSSSPERS